MANSKTTPLHPQGNPAERFNRTLLSMLRTLDEEKKGNWSDYVSKVVHTYNCTTRESTGYSPFYLLFGRHPRLPIDVIFGLNRENGCKTHEDFAQKWQQQMKEAYDVASKNIEKTHTRGKSFYDQKRQCAALSPGDRVLVRNMSERGGPGKLHSYLEDQVHVGISQKGDDSPVYEVKAERGKGQVHILHRNMLMPCNSLPLPLVTGSEPSSTRQEKKLKLKDKSLRNISDDAESSDDKDEQ